MDMCWGATPEERPSFSDIVRYLEENAPAEVRIEGDEEAMPLVDKSTSTNRSNKSHKFNKGN
jgi:hypothetical protein